MEKFIQEATAHFETLLRQQLARQEKMAQTQTEPPISGKAQIILGICPGDGIGPIIMTQARRVLETLLQADIAAGKILLREIPGLTLENRLAKNEPVPADTLAAIRQCDVLLKGPTTTPKGGSMASANVTLRRELDLFANVRPVCVPEKNIDWMFYRENTEGEYVLGSQGIDLPGKLAMDFKVTTDGGTRRIARAAFEYAKANGKTNVAIVTKANIMKKTDGNFSRICHEVAQDYPGITAEDWYIDIMCANLLDETLRTKFQVFLLPNLYGDIITDEAAQIQGGVGTAGSANLGTKYAMFEAIHGSAPRMIEEGLGEYANPSSLLKAVEMLLRHIGRSTEADRLKQALTVCNETEKRVTVNGTRSAGTCREFTDYVLEVLERI